MKPAILLLALLATVLFTGCTQQKFVCTDGKEVTDAKQCALATTPTPTIVYQQNTTPAPTPGDDIPPLPEETTTPTPTTTPKPTATPTPLPAPTIATAAGCMDSDNGADFYTPGYAEFHDGSRTFDVCDGGVLWEQMCRNGTNANEKYRCEYGCENAACIRPGATPRPAACNDSDASLGSYPSLFVKGTAVSTRPPRIGTIEDYCYEESAGDVKSCTGSKCSTRVMRRNHRR